ncbi:MAG TPA: response regulator [Polyangiaceae bacterium]|nr:response regulator [Polyangiaceae bacterium]
MTRILLVEDNTSLVKALSRTLSRQPDLTVVTSSDGIEASTLLAEQEFDVVITDLKMPRMDGFELLAWILTHRPSIPVFAMTGYASDRTFDRLNALGAIECFTKPLNVKLLLGRLRETLAQSIRGHVENVSLASFLQLIEMERKTCTLTVECNGNSGTLFIRRGQLLDARAGELVGEDAAISIVGWEDPGITIVSHCAVQDTVIDTPLGFIVMEAMRMKDEAMRDSPVSDFPESLGTVRPSEEAALLGGPLGVVPTSSGAGAPSLPNGTRALAVVDTATGALRAWTSREGVPLAELATLSAVVLRHEVAALTSCGRGNELEELVLSRSGHCDVIRPVDGMIREFALLVFARQETSLAMARIQLDRFMATIG